MSQFWKSFFVKQLHQPRFWVMLAIFCLFRLADSSFLPALPQISRDFGISANVAQLSVIIYVTAICLTLPFWGSIVDKYGRRTSFLLAQFVFLVGVLLCMLAPTFEIFFLGRFLQGMGGSGFSVLGQTLIRDVYQGQERAKAYSLLGMLIPVTPALGPLIGGTIDEFFHWRVIFLVTLLLNLGFGVYFYLRVAETKKKTSVVAELRARTVFKLLFKDREFLGYAMAMGFVIAVSMVSATEGSFLFINLFQLTPGQYGLTAGFIVCMFGLGGFISRQLLSRGRSPLQIISWGTKSLFSIGIFFVIVAGMNLTAPDSKVFGFFLTVFLISAMSLCAGMVGPNAVAAASNKHPQNAGTVSAVFTFIYYLCGNFGLILMSIAHDNNHYALPIILFGVSYLAVLNYSMLLRPRKNPRAGAAGEN